MAHRLLFAVVCMLLGALSATAGADDESSTPDERTRARLLHLVDGGILRAESRWRDGRWEIEEDGAWRPLASGSVASAPLERDVLAEARKRRTLARRRGPVEQVAAAEWMIAEGLLTEAFQLLEQVLASDRDQPEALALLHGGRIPVAVPQPPRADLSPDRLGDHYAAVLSWAAPMPLALQEMAVAALSPDPVLRAALTDGLRHPAPGTRRFSALALRRHFTGDAEPELTRRALVDIAPSVRMEAALALRELDDGEGLALCIDALQHPSTLVRTHAAQALSLMAAPQAVEPLIGALSAAGTASAGSGGRRAAVFFGTQRAFVQGFDAQVANQAAIADPIIGTVQSGASLDARVVSTGPVGTTTERRALRTALETVTGQRIGSTAAAWDRWWRREGQAWRAAHTPEVAPTTPTAEPDPSAPAFGEVW